MTVPVKHEAPVKAPLLRTVGLSKSYGGVQAIRGVSVDFFQGGAYGIIGPNGAGKSTLISLLGGALNPTSGQIIFDGQDVTSLKAPDRARLGIGRTYQVPRPFLEMSVLENLLTARVALHPFAPADESRHACELILQRTGLLEQQHWLAKDLPLLRRKRLEIARALSIEPRVLLLDEVGAGLVDGEVSELIELITSLKSEVESVIIIEHVLRVVRECCDRSLVINFGEKVAEGPTREVLESDEVARIYLGSAAQRAQGNQSPVDSRSLPNKQDETFAIPDTTPIIELKGICAGYGQAKVLQDLCFSIQPGRTVAILGANGAGKSTLASVISGVLRPTSGQLLIDGEDAVALLPHERARRGIAQCQEGRKIFPNLSVEENLLISTRGLSKFQRSDRLGQIYELFPDLHKRRHDGGTSMSGGQQQMLAIGRALMSRPRLVVFDEISLGLAPVMMDRLYEALAELKVGGMTLLVVEQDIVRALDLADEVHVMEHGRIALSGASSAVRMDPRLKSLYIGEA